MKTTTVISIILGVLLLISVVQAFQLNGLKEKVAEGQLSVSSSSAANKTSSSSSSGDSRQTGELPKSIKNLPAMVGGC